MLILGDADDVLQQPRQKAVVGVHRETETTLHAQTLQQHPTSTNHPLDAHMAYTLTIHCTSAAEPPSPADEPSPHKVGLGTTSVKQKQTSKTWIAGADADARPWQ